MLGIGPVLRTWTKMGAGDCAKDNIASARTIQTNSGIFENEIRRENGNLVQRYRITISSYIRPVNYSAMS